MTMPFRLPRWSWVFALAGLMTSSPTFAAFEEQYAYYWQHPIWTDEELAKYEQNPASIPTCVIQEPYLALKDCWLYSISSLERVKVSLEEHFRALSYLNSSRVYTDYRQYQRVWRTLNILRMGWISGLREFLRSDVSRITVAQRDYIENLVELYRVRPFVELASQEQFHAYRFSLGEGCEDPNSGTIRFLKDYYQESIIVGAYRDGREGQWGGRSISDDKLEVLRNGDISLLGDGVAAVGSEYNLILARKRALDALSGQPGYDEALSQYESAKYDFSKNTLEPYMASRLLDVTWKIWDRFQAFYVPLQELRKRVFSSGCNGYSSFDLSDAVLFSVGLMRDVSFSKRDAGCQKLRGQIDEIDAILAEQNSTKVTLSNMPADRVLATFVAGYPDLYRLLVSRLRSLMPGDPFDGVFRVLCMQYRLSEPAIARFLRPIGDWLNYLGAAAAFVPGGQGVAVASELLGSVASIGQHSAEIFGKVGDAQFAALFGVSREEVRAAVTAAVGEGALNLSVDLLATALQVRGYRSDLIRDVTAREWRAVKNTELELAARPARYSETRFLNEMPADEALAIERAQRHAFIRSSASLSGDASGAGDYIGFKLKTVEFDQAIFEKSIADIRKMNEALSSDTLTGPFIKAVETMRMKAHAEFSSHLAAYFKRVGIKYEFRTVPSMLDGRSCGEFKILEADSKNKVMHQLIKAVSPRKNVFNGAQKEQALSDLINAISEGKLVGRARGGVESGAIRISSQEKGGSTLIRILDKSTGEPIFSHLVANGEASDADLWLSVREALENDIKAIRSGIDVIDRKGADLYFSTAVLDGTVFGWTNPREDGGTKLFFGKALLNSLGLNIPSERGLDQLISRIDRSWNNARGKLRKGAPPSVDITTLHELFHAKKQESGDYFLVISYGDSLVRSSLQGGPYGRIFSSEEFEAAGLELNHVISRRARLVEAIADRRINKLELYGMLGDFYETYATVAQFYTVEKKLIQYMKEHPNHYVLEPSDVGFNVRLFHSEYKVIGINVVNPKKDPSRSFEAFLVQSENNLDSRALNLRSNIEMFEREIASQFPNIFAIKAAYFDSKYEFMEFPKR